MGLISEIKNDISRTGQNKEKILYVRTDEKVRVRFLDEIDDGYSFTFHQIWDDGIVCICPKEVDEDNECKYCEMDGKDEKLRTYKMYAWSVYNFETKRVEIALFKANKCTPVQQLVELSANYGTILDRDYVLMKRGKGFDTSYTVIPQDKQKFRNEKALPFSREGMLKVLVGAYPYEDPDKEDEETDEVEEVETEKEKKTSSKKSSKNNKEKKYARLDEELPTTSKKSSKSKKQVDIIDPEDDEEELDVNWMEETLDDEDIDVDEFLEYNEIKSLKKLKNKTEKQFKKMIKEYLDSLEEEDEEDDEEDEDEDYEDDEE